MATQIDKRNNEILTSDFPIKKDAYLSFDAVSMKQHIKDRLNEANIFTDQNFEGSNISTVVDIVAYTFHVLMYYLNISSTESMFSDSQLYENMNRIVKMIDYKPIGRQTSTLTFTSLANNFGPGVYTIPRYSFISVNNISYSFNEDITFSKATAGLDSLDDLSDQKLLFQGNYIEHPIYTAKGQENEIIFLLPGENVFIDHFNVDVYVKNTTTALWSQWEQTPSLYLENATVEKYEVRLNENKNYEIKFGNNINGKRLNEGDTVAIYFLETKGHAGEINAGELKGKSLTEYSTPQFDEILSDVSPSDQFTFLATSDIKNLSFDNSSVSTFAAEEETTDDIRKNAPGIFRSQHRLVTSNDYENYIKTNFANLIHDVKVSNNWTYLSQQMKYYYDLGISDPNNSSRVLYNQVQFADACNFNNVYLTVIPKTISDANPLIYLSPVQKQLVLTSMQNQKMLTSEVVLIDPTYISVALGLPESGKNIAAVDADNTELLVVKASDSRRDNASIVSDIEKIFTNYFDRTKTYLGQTIDVNKLTDEILKVSGVQTFYTRRNDDTSVKVSGLALYLINTIYGDADTIAIFKNQALPYFKYPYLHDKINFHKHIVVESETKIFEGVEY